MTSNTEHGSESTDTTEPDPAEITGVIPLASHPRPTPRGAMPTRRTDSTPIWGQPPPPAPEPGWVNTPGGPTDATRWPGPTPWPSAGPAAFPAPPMAVAAAVGPRGIRAAGMRWGWIVIGVIGAVLAVTLLVAVASAHQVMVVQGSVTLRVPWSNLSAGSSCAGAGQYSWLHPGSR